MIAVYDLAENPTTFDFVSWVVGVKTLGADHVHFRYEGKIADWKYPKDIAWRRFGNILLPVCKIARMDWTLGTGGSADVQHGYHYGQLHKLYKELGRIEKLTPTVEEKSKGHVTVTIRESFRNKHRNSNPDAWKKFIKYLEGKNETVVVFPDSERNVIDVEYRFALYHNAKQNLGVNNGPMALCHYSDAPHLTFNIIPRQDLNDIKGHMEKCNFGDGSQFDWWRKDQRQIWEPDDYEILVRVWNEIHAG